MAKQSTAVTKNRPAPPPARRNEDELPAYMQGKAGQGVEMIGQGDIEIPRIKLMQGLSPELEQYNGLKAGDFFHTLTEKNLGNEVRIIPVYIDKRFILWNPREAGGGILARADDGIHWTPADAEFAVKLDKKDGGHSVTWRTAKTVQASRLDQWGTMNPKDKNSPPAATQMFNCVVMFPDEPDMPPAVVTLQRTAIKVARRLLGKLKITRAPAYGLVFKMGVVQEGDAQRKYYNYTFQGDGMVQDEDLFNRCEEMYHTFKEQGLAIRDLESIGDEASTDQEEPETEDPKGRPKY